MDKSTHFSGQPLYAVIMRFDSLREIFTSMLVEARKLSHLRLVSC